MTALQPAPTTPEPIVRRMIHSGKLQHLDPVPSESSLVQAYGVSRDTVRRTTALLREEGVVFTVPTAEPMSARDPSSSGTRTVAAMTVRLCA